MPEDPDGGVEVGGGVAVEALEDEVEVEEGSTEEVWVVFVPGFAVVVSFVPVGSCLSASRR